MLSLVALVVAQHPTIGHWTLQTGTSVSVVIVEPSEKLAWRPDGSSIKFDSLPRTTAEVWSNSLADSELVALTNSGSRDNGGPTVRFKLASAPITDSAFSMVSIHPNIWLSGTALTTGQPAQENVAVGIADGPWKVKGWVGFEKRGRDIHERIRRGIDFNPDFTGAATPDKSSDVAGKTDETVAITVVLPESLKDVAVRIVARKFGDKEMAPAGSSSPTGFGTPTTFFFTGDKSDLKRIELQTRPLEWTTIWSTHFRPNP